MKIQPKQIKVRDLYDGYKDSGDAGVVGFGGQLNIRPAYQREFVYKDEQRNKVIDTVRKGYPLNVMYWVRNPDPVDPLNDDLARFEVLDGQQRTLSIRQDYLETALKWASKGNPASYMAAHQFDKTAFDLWSYFSSVIGWVKLTFPTVRKEMKAIPWGELYDTYKGENLDPVALEVRIVELMKDEDVTRKAGIYTYVLDGNRKHLSLRAFTPNTKTEVYNRQGGICAAPGCSKPGHKFELEEMEADHIVPWHAGGKTIASNCQMLCKDCNGKKGGAVFIPAMATASASPASPAASAAPSTPAAPAAPGSP